MIKVSVAYPDGTESIFHATEIESFIGTILGGKESVIEKGLQLSVDGVKYPLSEAKVVEPKPTPNYDLPPPVRRPKKVAA